MKARLSPTECLDFESAEVRSLRWLPLAVRYKLDEAGLKLSLQQWQSLSPQSRAELVRRLPEEGFVQRALDAGARAQPSAGDDDAQIDEVGAAAQVLGCSASRAQEWLVNASPFARYVLRRRIRHLSCPDQRNRAVEAFTRSAPHGTAPGIRCAALPP